MAALAPMFADYAAYHRTAGNKWCHRVGIPLIMFSLFGLLAEVVLVRTSELRLDLALVLIAAASIWYFAADWRFGAIMLVVSLAMWAAALFVPFWIHVALFVLGWVLQFVGHGVFEKRKPAFFRNFVHLLVGPLWILNDAVRLVPED
ncbi:MAG: DUF962 domain-containing protein [Thermoanaerobaculia bacterium]